MKTSNKILFSGLGMILLSGLAILIFVRANLIQREMVKPSGDVKTEMRNVEKFSTLIVDGPYTLELSKTAKGLKIEGDQSYIDRLRIIQNGDRLELRNDPASNYSQHNNKLIVFTLAYDQVKYLKVEQSAFLFSKDIISTDALEISLQGAGSTELAIHVKELKLSVFGAGQAVLKGTAQNMEMRATGAGGISAADLLSETAKVRITGAGNASVHASKTIDMKSSGASDISYSGGAEVIGHSTSGSSSIRKVD